MSLFLGRRISKLSASALRENFRLISSLPQFPCLLLDSGEIVQESAEVTTEKVVCTSEKKDLHSGIFKLTDLYKPWVSSPRVISLPSLGDIPGSTFCHTRVSLSSDPAQENKFCLAEKFSNFQHLCRPCCDDPKWTRFNTPLTSASAFMYSKRDKSFYFTTSECLRMGLLDPSYINEVKYKNIHLRNLLKISLARRELLVNCLMTRHLVEAPSGQIFFIKWYTKCIHQGDFKAFCIRSHRFIVFTEDHEKSSDFCYTEDIGDLCIFLSEGEAFCLSASMYPGLKPNSIYYTSRGVCCYNIDTSYDESDIYWLNPTDPIHKKGTVGVITLPASTHTTCSITLTAKRNFSSTSCSDIDGRSCLHQFQHIRGYATPRENNNEFLSPTLKENNNEFPSQTLRLNNIEFSCLLLDSEIVHESPEGNMIYNRVFDAAKEIIVYSSEKLAPKNLHRRTFKGASQGWFLVVNTDGTLHITDLYNPSVLSPRAISLPPLIDKPSSYGMRVSKSSNPALGSNFWVAAKFYDKHLSICRPQDSCDSNWTHVSNIDKLPTGSDLM